jgi:hypothetical protein
MRIHPSLRTIAAILRGFRSTAKSPMTQTEALILSLALEAAVAFALVCGLRWGSGARAALAAIVGTLFTHPLVWLSLPRLEVPLGYWWALALVEGGVVLVESLPYRLFVPLRWRRALLASLVANAASTGAGLGYYALAG